jgi:hypothetical protein
MNFLVVMIEEIGIINNFLSINIIRQLSTLSQLDQG